MEIRTPRLCASARFSLPPISCAFALDSTTEGGRERPKSLRTGRSHLQRLGVKSFDKLRAFLSEGP
jgi:hypothetical protein